ncbi:hypothetical protein CLF_103126 [Clonorchis sinensis]|uniref:Uncharacterized protein n=1 Tax=Clonorchis sinensis TaxID=79923 RepID=G7YNC5_CLOSI|nr:hypothetical protein CLF_103126 [Clonorchis sinensis]
MRIFDLLVCALFSPTISLGRIIIYEDCGSRDAFVVAVGITPCNILPCVLMHGKPYTIEITFIASAHIKSEDALVEVLYGSVRKSFRMRSSAKFQHLDPPSPIRPGLQSLAKTVIVFYSKLAVTSESFGNDQRLRTRGMFF